MISLLHNFYGINQFGKTIKLIPSAIFNLLLFVFISFELNRLIIYFCIFVAFANLLLTYLIVMKPNNDHSVNKKGKQHLAITAELLDILRQVNFNASWKMGSNKFNKTKTGCMRPEKQDLDRLFNRSKEKIQLKTEVVALEDSTEQLDAPKVKDLTAIKFLHLEDEFDKMLTGMPCTKQQGKQNSKALQREDPDLTIRFKRDYMVGKVIGEGAYASVRVAVYKPQNRKIAIKAYQKTKIREPQRKKTVKREIKILQMVKHPNIVQLFDVVQTNNHVNIVMEYLPGISLGTSLKQQPSQRFLEQPCKQIIKELAGALKYLHQRNIAHRDIKLQNVILDEKLSPKLIDFGFSTCIEKSKKIKIFCGTPSYMAPEIVQKKEYRGQAADIWALGVMLFVMLTGYFPYKGASDQQLYRRINLADYPKAELVSFKRAAHLLTKMFIIDPEERITADGILNHTWLNENQSQEPVKRTRNQPSELKKMLNSSKEKDSPFGRFEDRSKRKKLNQIVPERSFLKTVKDLTGKLGNTLGRGKLQKTLAVPLIREEGSLSNKKPKPEPQVRIVDLLRFQLKARSSSKSKCKSHRM